MWRRLGLLHCKYKYIHISNGLSGIFGLKGRDGKPTPGNGLRSRGAAGAMEGSSQACPRSISKARSYGKLK
jgi:hypothetical protein